MRGFVAIGDEIRRLRRQQGMTQKHLAMESGCSVRTVRNAELCRAIDLNTVARIAAALETRVPSIAATETAPLCELQQQKNVVLDWCAALLEADHERILLLYDEQAIISRPGADEHSGGDSHQGSHELRTYFQWEIANFRIQKFVQQRLDAVDQLVFHRSQVSMRSISTGRTFSAYIVNEFEFQNGRIVRQTIVTDFSALK